MSPEYSIQTSTFCALVSPSSRQISATSSGASLSRTKAGTSTITAVTSSMSFIALVTCVQKTRGTTSTLSCATSRSEKVAAPSPPYDQTTAGPSQMFTPTSPSEPSTEQALLSYSPPSIPSSQRTVHIASVTNLSLYPPGSPTGASCPSTSSDPLRLHTVLQAILSRALTSMSRPECYTSWAGPAHRHGRPPLVDLLRQRV